MVLTNIKYSSIILCILMLWSSVYNLNAQCGLTINPASASLCLGNSIALNASDTGNAAPFRWSPAAGLSSTTGANIVASPTSTTTYTLKKNGCPDSATITITVKQLYIIAAAADSLCEDDQLLLSSLALGGNGVYSYNWSGPNGFISSAANPNVPNVSSVNGGTYIVTVTSNGCSISDSVYVIVNPLPIANQLPDTFICNGSLMGNGFIFSSTPPGATFTWTCSQNINFGISGSGDIPAFTATNTGAQNISETVFFNPVLKGCIGTNENFKITIKPTPKLTSSTEEHLCDKSNFSYTATAQPQNSLFSWARAADVFGNVANSGNNATINENLFNNSVLPIEVMYVYTLTRPGIVNPCPKIDTLKVTVNPTPVLDIISNYSYCNGEVVMPIAFSTLTPNAAIEWTSSDNVGFGIAGINAIQGFVATNNTGVPIVATITVKIKASEDSCVGLNKTFTITVNSSPRLSSTQDTIICNSTSFNHLATSQTPNLDFSWTRAGVAGINGGLAAAGNDSLINEVLVNTDTIPIAVWYIFQMANNSGTCVGKDSMRVTVIPTPQLSSDTSPISICSGSLLVYNATSATGSSVFLDARCSYWYQ
ncbi:MAG: hypothetical protein IPO27_08395 [Bacteroidetes bacterium]|nr:hypothetical protein [Bacteroidota bacterium]